MCLRYNIPDCDNNVNDMNILIVTCGHWDLNVMAIKEYKNHNISPHSVYARYANIKHDFAKLYKTSGKNGMVGMLTELGIPLEGKHHSGIDDCRNISKILIKMFQNGFTFEQFIINFVDFGENHKSKKLK